MELSGKLQATDFGVKDYSLLVKNFCPEKIDALRRRFFKAIDVLVTFENVESMFFDPLHIFDYKDWRFYIHKSLTESGESVVISVLAYNAKFEVLPITLQVGRVASLLSEISDGRLDEGEILRSWPGHVAFIFKVSEK